MNHYDRLRIGRAAAASEIRVAYRREARREHPDRHGEASSGAMAAVNEAYRVLGDPGRRARYDDELDEASPHPSTGHSTSVPSPDRPRHTGMADDGGAATPASYQPARFPWRFMLFLASVGIAIVIVGAIVYEPPPAVPPDNVLRVGDCVVLSLELEATEVNCADPHDAIMQVLIPVGQVCPTGTDAYRDHQGMGTACVIKSSV